MHTTVSSMQVVLLAPGESPAAQANARGHLFEEFVAQLMALFGYETPTRSSLSTTSNGIELDVVSHHKLTKQRMVAECKAYSSPVEARELAAFYGKLNVERFDEPDTFGHFVAIPGLTKNGRDLQAKLEASDIRFRTYVAEAILQMLVDRQQVTPFSAVLDQFRAKKENFSDEALLVTRDGLFYSAKQVSPSTRLPTGIVVFPTRLHEQIPPRVLELLSVHTYAAALPCVPASGAPQTKPATPPPDDAIIEVVGSSSDFEYQFPAAPKYFVGRQSYIADIKDLIEALCAGPAERARVLVLNAQSGWGKSSLSLRIIELAQSLGGYGVCIDCRTASHATFASTAMRHALLKAQNARTVTLSQQASFASVSSTLETLRTSQFTPERKPICIVFDQFENVFQNGSLTHEFRDLALGITDLSAPVILGFSWKTDFVAFTESYPYQLRDDIRSRSTVFTLSPFGPTEIGELLARLQKSCGVKIHPYLRERIREYSQGLPWLFKKLGNHIIREIKKGSTQDQLLAEVLNIQSLFENDISSLNIAELQALKQIARRAPLAVTEAVDLASGDKDIVQSLVTQRLLVSVGEKLDIYWDVFRDYLNQGMVPLQDSYILRLTPNGVRKLLIAIKNAGRPLSTDEVAGNLGTSAISVLNMARDLRQLGVLAAQEGVLRFADDLATAENLNLAIKQRAAAALKRHRVYSLLTSLSPTGGNLRMSEFAAALPKAYPAVDAKDHTWGNYARAFAYWFEFAGLVSIARDEIVVGPEESTTLDLMAPGKKRATRGVDPFPRSFFQPVLNLMRDLASDREIGDDAAHALTDARSLELVEEGAHGTVLSALGRKLAESCDEDLPTIVRASIEAQPMFSIAEALLKEDPGTPPLAIGSAIARRLGVDWAQATAVGVGKRARSWMRAAGFETTLRIKRAQEALPLDAS